MKTSIVFAIIAFVVVLTTTQQGIGVSPDSIAYLSTAESIAAGRGAMEITPEGWRPLMHFPSLYPLVLSVIDARALNLLLFPLFIVIASLVAYRAGGSLAVSILTAAVLLASRDVVHAWSMAWSEPLFFVLLFAFLAALVRYFEQGGRDARPPLLIAALLASACVLTRYAGISVVVTGAIAVLLWGDRRIRDAAIFTAVAMLPVAGWLLRNAIIGGSATLVYHPPPFSAYTVGAENVFRFFTRGWDVDRIPRNLLALAGALLVAVFASPGCASAYTTPSSRRCWPSSRSSTSSRSPPSAPFCTL